MGRQRKQFPLRACMPAVERGFADSSKQTLLAITLEVVVKPALAIAHLLWKWWFKIGHLSPIIIRRRLCVALP